MNILTDKCFKVETKSLCEDRGWVVEDTMMATGFEVIAMLAFDIDEPDADFSYTLMKGDKPNREQPEPSDLLDAAMYAMVEVERRYPRRRR